MLTAVASACVLNPGDTALFLLGREFGYDDDEVEVEILEAHTDDSDYPGFVVRLPNGYDKVSNTHLIDPETRTMRFRVEADLLVTPH